MIFDTAARHSIVLDPGVRSFLDQVAEAGLSPYTPEGFDQAVSLAARLQERDEGGNEGMTRITLVDEGADQGGKFSLILKRPPGTVGPTPVLFYVPGGFWAFGGWETHGGVASRLAAGCGAALVFVDAGRAPPVLAPQALRRVHRALDWLITEGADHGLDTGSAVLAGDGCGGAMAAMLATARPAGWPGFRFQLLAHPIVADCVTATEAGDWLDLDAFQRCSARAFGTPGVNWPALSPLALPLERLRRSPPTLVLTAEADLARDGGEAFARRLMLAEVEVSAVRLVGTIHDFFWLEGLAGTSPSLTAHALARQALRAALVS